MKKIFLFVVFLGFMLTFSSCDLDKYPETGYSEFNNPGGTGEGGTAVGNREQLHAQLTAMYQNMKNDMQDYWYKLLVYADVRADNAYGGNLGEPKVVAVESNHIDSDNEFPRSFWDASMSAVDKANQVIYNIDNVRKEDNSLTDEEANEWMSEALCWRAYIWINMMQMFGEIPMITAIPPAITSENIEEVYSLYFPKRVSIDTLGEQIKKDLEFACKYAPDVDNENKFKITKGFAHGLFARFYALRKFRNWDLVKQHCEAVENLGYSLCEKYSDLWAYDINAKICAINTSESIFEVNWGSNSNTGAWMFIMFHRNAWNPNDSWDWAKWCTPSRLIIKAYNDENDVVRKNTSIVFDKCTWSFHYPKDNYAFMNKLPTNLTPIYVMRLADIILLHAEALANLNDLSGALQLVNKIRKRACIEELKSFKDGNALEGILHERRLELAFEGIRWFDLERYGDDYSKLIEVCNAVNNKDSESYDSYYQQRKPMDDNHVIMSVPTTVLDVNPNLAQNPGY